MVYKEFLPSQALSAFIQCYYVCEVSDERHSEDRVFASGAVEIMFNLGPYRLRKVIGGKEVCEPFIQLWGQTIRPLIFTGGGKHSMLGVRFFPHTAACFFGESIADFNDQIVDFELLKGSGGRQLYQRVSETKLLAGKLEILNDYFISELLRFKARHAKVNLMKNVLWKLQGDGSLKRISSIASSYGMSARYLQKLCVEYSGLSPGLFGKIARFRRSLNLVAENDLPLTGIAYQSGYYDQPHFIRDFKFFTGLVPSHFRPELSTDFLVEVHK